MKFSQMTESELKNKLAVLKQQYENIKKQGLKLDMSRGKPCKKQLDLTNPMLDILKAQDCVGSTDMRNYGIIDGIPEAKKMFADLLEVSPDNIIVGGNSSLNLMYDTVARCMLYGHNGGKPWCKLDKVKFIAPVPGYDRHFAICESLGIEMINVKMTDDGPDMDEVERIVASDETVKGMWNVPKYSNPGGVVYSDETVKRLASMKCAADDFLLMWDNAYVIHALEGEAAKIPEIISECKKAGNENRVIEFASTSKISFPGAGVAALASSTQNIAAIKKIMASQTIGYDKLNQLRHIKFFGDAEGLKAQAKKHAEIIRPKFELVDKMLTESLADKGIASWSKPQGGYFISYNVPEGCAARTVLLCKEAGVVLTGAGATYPYKNDEADSNIRIAPTMPPIEELEKAIEVLCVCTQIAALEKLCK